MFDVVRQQQPYLDALTTPLYDRKATIQLAPEMLEG